MYNFNEFEAETQAPDFWTKDHYADDPTKKRKSKSQKRIAPYDKYAPICYPDRDPLPVPDAFHQAKSERLSSYGRANGHQKLFIKNSLVLLAGPPKIGKTTIAVALGKAIAQGKPFGGFQLEKQQVGYLSYDDSPGEILATIDRHPDITASTNFYLNIEAMPIDTPEGREAIENFLISRMGKGIVIIDSLHAAISKSQTRDARAIRKLITPLKHLAERAGTIILLHHTDARGQQIADHTQLQAAVSQTIQMKLEQRDNCRIIQWKSQGRGRRICRNAYFRSENETHYAPHNPNPLAKLDPRDRSTKPILEALAQSPMKVREISHQTGLTLRRVQKRVKQLLESSVINRTASGHLACTA